MMRSWHKSPYALIKRIQSGTTRSNRDECPNHLIRMAPDLSSYICALPWSFLSNYRRPELLPAPGAFPGMRLDLPSALRAEMDGGLGLGDHLSADLALSVRVHDIRVAGLADTNFLRAIRAGTRFPWHLPAAVRARDLPDLLALLRPSGEQPGYCYRHGKNCQAHHYLVRHLRRRAVMMSWRKNIMDGAAGRRAERQQGDDEAAGRRQQGRRLIRPLLPFCLLPPASVLIPTVAALSLCSRRPRRCPCKRVRYGAFRDTATRRR